MIYSFYFKYLLICLQFNEMPTNIFYGCMQYDVCCVIIHGRRVHIRNKWMSLGNNLLNVVKDTLRDYVYSNGVHFPALITKWDHLLKWCHSPPIRLFNYAGEAPICHTFVSQYDRNTAVLFLLFSAEWHGSGEPSVSGNDRTIGVLYMNHITAEKISKVIRLWQKRKAKPVTIFSERRQGLYMLGNSPVTISVKTVAFVLGITYFPQIMSLQCGPKNTIHRATIRRLSFQVIKVKGEFVPVPF